MTNSERIQANNADLREALDMASNLPDAGEETTPVIESLSVTANGTYTAPDGVDGYSPVTVNVPIPEGYVKSSEIEDAFIARTFGGDYENDRVTSIGYGCFHSCANLTSVSFPNVTELKGYTFYGCSKLTSASLPNVTSVGGHVFNLCSSLTTISLPLLKSAGTYAFSSTKISVIDFPLLETMGSYTFGNITASCTVNLPKLATAANSGFRNSKGITRVDLATASKVDNLSFYFCNSLETLILRKADAICTLSHTNAFTGSKIASGTGYIYVPKTLADGTDGVATYQAATNWSTFASQFRAIEDYPDITGG